MSRPGASPTSAKMAASLTSRRLPKRPRLSRRYRRRAIQSSTASSKSATTTFTPKSQA